MFEMIDQDYRDSETVWILIRNVNDKSEHVVLELSKKEVKDLLDNFDQDED